MKPWLRRTLLWLGGLELCYLLVANLVLNLPLTQTLINQHKPEKYAVHWQRAWTWYPLRVHARGIAADGQTARLQWAVDAPAASASVALLPLLRRTVQLHDVEIEDANYRQRPRPRPGKDYAAIREFFPPVPGRSLDAPAGPAPAVKGGPGWTIQVRDLHAGGSHRLWLYQVKGKVEGDFYAHFSYQTRGGPFSMEDGRFDLRWESLTINRDQGLFQHGTMQGSVALSPYVPREHRGIKNMLPFLDLDARIDAELGSFQFLDFYLHNIHGMRLDGVGSMSAGIKLAKGRLLAGTKIELSSNELSLVFASHRIQGSSTITMEVGEDDPDSLHLGILFGELNTYYQGEKAPLFQGEGLAIRAKGPASLIPREGERYRADSLVLHIPWVTAPDLRHFKRYLPKKWPVVIHGGSGRFRADARLTKDAFHGTLNLSSGDADVAFEAYRFKSDLDLSVNIDAPSLASGEVDLSGSTLRLNDATLSSAGAARGQGAPKPWQAAFEVVKGQLRIPPFGGGAEARTRRWARAFTGKELKAHFARANGEVRIEGQVSSLGWIGQFVRNNHYNLAIDGVGNFATDLRVASGHLATGSRLEVQARKLDVKVLDYVVEGDGSVVVEVTRAGEHPALGLDLEVSRAQLRRFDDRQAFVKDVTLNLEAASAYDQALGRNQVDSLRLRIPSAAVTDMAVYNRYLPGHSPLRILGGRGKLRADVRFGPGSAKGYVKLSSDGLRLRVDEQRVAARLSAHIRLAGGVPRDMAFDIAGSTLALDRVRVTGEQKDFDGKDWGARMVLRKGRVVWRKPLRLRLDAELTIKDSRPIVAMVANRRGKAGWLDKVLTVEDIRGKAKLDVADERITIPYAFASSDKVDVGAKGVIDAHTRDGVFYLRYRKLKGILKIQDGHHNFDILHAKRTFDQYRPP